MYTVLTSHRHPAPLIYSLRMARQQIFVLYCIVRWSETFKFRVRGETFGLWDRGKAKHFKNLTRDCLEVNQSRGLLDTLQHTTATSTVVIWFWSTRTVMVPLVSHWTNTGCASGFSTVCHNICHLWNSSRVYFRANPVHHIHTWFGETHRTPRA